MISERCIRLRMTDFEQFKTDELKSLRDELMQSGLDSFQAAELLTGFLGAKGYGVSAAEARTAASNIEALRFAIPTMQEELEKIAFVM